MEPMYIPANRVLRWNAELVPRMQALLHNGTWSGEYRDRGLHDSMRLGGVLGWYQS